MDIYNVLKELSISYKELEHQPVYTVEEAKSIHLQIDGVGCKNLFLTDKKNYYLLLLKEDKKANLKEIAKSLGIHRFSFAGEEELKQYLNLTPGSVTPFGLIYDKEHTVKVIVDKELENQTILFHPNRNTSTISITYNDLLKFLDYVQNEYLFLD